MLCFMQNSSFQQVGPRAFKPLTRYILCSKSNSAKPRDFLANTGNAETAFLGCLATVGMDNHWIDKHDLRARFLIERGIDYRNSLAESYLRCRQANTVSGIHCFEHIFDERCQIATKFGDGVGRHLQDWVAEFCDYVNHSLINGLRELVDAIASFPANHDLGSSSGG